MKTTTQPHGVHYEFNNGYTLSVLNDWAAMGTPECPYEFMAWGNGKKTEAVGYQTKEDIDKIISMFKENNTELIDKFFDDYSPCEPRCPEDDYSPEDDDYFFDDCPDYLEESRERVPRLQKEVQEIQAELDEQLRLLGDTAIPSMIISVTRQGSGYNEDVFYTTITSISLKDGQIIEDCAQESTHSYSDMECECAEETEVLNQLRPLRLHLKLAKAGYKVISSHNL